MFSGPAKDPKGRVTAIRVPGGASLSRKQIDEYTKFVGIYGAKGLAWIKVNELAPGQEGLQSPILKFLSEDITDAIIQRTGAQAGAAAKRIAVGHDCSLSPVCGAAIPSVARCTWPGLDRPVLGASAAVIMQHRARAGRSHTYTRSCVAIGAVGCGRNVDAPLAHRAGHHHRRNHAIFAAARCAARVRQLPCSAT